MKYIYFLNLKLYKLKRPNYFHLWTFKSDFVEFEQSYKIRKWPKNNENIKIYYPFC